MKEKTLIFLTGYAGAGKDTLAEYVLCKLGECMCDQVAYVDKLKEIAAKIFGLPGAYFRRREFKGRIIEEGELPGIHPFAFGKTPRELLQFVGAKFREIFGEDFWVDAALPFIDQNLNNYSFCVLSDVRYANEYTKPRQCFPDARPVVIRVERDGVGPANGHESEKPIDFGTIADNYLVFHAPEDVESQAYAEAADALLSRAGILPSESEAKS